VIEWAVNVKIVTFRIYAENTTNTIEIVIQYLTITKNYVVVSSNIHKRRPPTPTHI